MVTQIWLIAGFLPTFSMPFSPSTYPSTFFPLDVVDFSLC